MLEPITERTFYIPGANNIGVVTTGDGGAIVIDTGLDKNVARKLRKSLDEAGLTLRAIINTHHHADHIGGNDYLVRNLPDVQVYAPPMEATIIEYPVLEPTFLNNGATPIQPLRHRWLMAQGVRVHHLIGTVEDIVQGHSFGLQVEGITFEVVPLSGHSIAQVGLVLDGVCFAADGFFGPAVVAKHGILYAHDVAAQLATFERLAGRREAWFLPGHGELTPASELAHALAANQSATLRASELVLSVLPGNLVEVTARVHRLLNAPPDSSETAAPTLTSLNIPQYAVFSGAISAHLALLEQQGRAYVELDAHGLTWHSAG